MKFSLVLPFAAVSAAFVLPSQEVFNELAIEDRRGGNGWYDEAAQTKDDILSSFREHFDEVTETSKDAWSTVVDCYQNAVDAAYAYADDAVVDWQAWLETEELDDRRPHHGHHGKPNQTVYQLIAESKYTTVLAKLISEYDDLVEALNSTKANYTVFAPTDRAFKKIPEGAPKPSKEQLKDILSYHVVPGFYPAGRVLASHTAPTLLKVEHLAPEPMPQRIAFKIGLNGLTVNFYSRIVAINIFGTNGVIHGVDSIIVPPPSVVKIIDLFPEEFSTLELGLIKTGLIETLNTTDHPGGTLFAPSNFAFRKLGPKINAFLFSQYGLKYLKALLEYHVAADNTLYSDAFYKGESSEVEATKVPEGVFHVDLPTLLKDRSVGVDIARYGGFIEIKINAFSRVTVQDGIAADGVIHTVSDVIVPPKKVGGADTADLAFWTGEEMEVEEFIERLQPLVAKSDL